MTVTKRPLNVGLIGLGTVGSQVADRMLSWGPQLSRRAGVELCLKKVLVRDVAKRRAIAVSGDLLTADATWDMPPFVGWYQGAAGAYAYCGALQLLGQVETTRGRLDEAVRVLDECLEVTRKQFGPGHVQVAYTLSLKAAVAHRRREYVAARALYREALGLVDDDPGHRFVKLAILRTAGTSAEAGSEQLDPAPRAEEACALALRTRAGSPIDAAAAPVVAELAASGFVRRVGDRVVLTPRGRLLASDVTARLLVAGAVGTR